MLKHCINSCPLTSGQELIQVVVSLQKKDLWQMYNNVSLPAFNPVGKPVAVCDTFVCGYKVQVS